MFIGKITGKMAEASRFGFQVFKDYKKMEIIFTSMNLTNLLTIFVVTSILTIVRTDGIIQTGTTKAQIYIWLRGGQKKNMQPKKAKYGERICYSRLTSGELIDLTDNYYKDHCKTCYYCSNLGCKNYKS